MDAFVRFCCPACGRRIKAKQGDVQYAVPCKCGFELIIPGREPVVPAREPVVPGWEPVIPGREPVIPGREPVESHEEFPRPRARPKSWGWFARTCFFLLGVGLAVLLAMVCPPGPGDREELQGLWNVFALESRGRQLPARALLTSEPPFATLAFHGDRMSYLRSGKGSSVFSFELDEKTEPRSIDVTRLEGPRAGETWHGIYEIEGDKLRIMFAPAKGKARPAELKTDAHSDEGLYCYRRLTAKEPRWLLQNASLQSLESVTGKTTYQIEIDGKDRHRLLLSSEPGRTQVVLRFELTAEDPDPFAIERILSYSMGEFIQDAVDRATNEEDKNLLRCLKQCGKKYAFFDVSQVDLIRSVTKVPEVVRWVMIPARVHIFDVDVGGGFRSQAQMDKGSESWPLTCRYSLRKGELVPDFQGLVEAGQPVAAEIIYSLPEDWHKRAYTLSCGEGEAVPVKVVPDK